MTADQLVEMVRKENERKKRLAVEASAIARAVVEKALNPPPPPDNEGEVKDGTRQILLEKYHANRKQTR